MSEDIKQMVLVLLMLSVLGATIAGVTYICAYAPGPTTTEACDQVCHGAVASVSEQYCQCR